MIPSKELSGFPPVVQIRRRIFWHSGHRGTPLKWTEKVGKWKAMRNFNAFLYIMMVEKPTTNCAKRDYQRTLNFSLCELCGLHGFLEFLEVFSILW